MKVIALAQTYNEELYIKRNLKWVYDVVDEIVVSEGRLTPFGGLPRSSTDNTRKILLDFIAKNDKDNKIKFCDAHCINPNDREKAEGQNKNNLLNHSSVEHGDIIFINDTDEFFEPNAFCDIINIIKDNDDINFVVAEEWQFAYNTSLACKASHGRFYRYKDGSRFGNTNHFIHPNGKDISKHADLMISRDRAKFFHMCWVKPPLDIRNKVLSFNRSSFTTWYNYVYLLWPYDPEAAYKNNKILSFPMGWPGGGFLEGQQNRLEEFSGTLPEVLQDLKVDYIQYIKDNHTWLTI